MATLPKKGTKVRHKTKGMIETIVGLCKVKYMGVWVDGVIYEGNDVHTGEPMTFVRVKEDFENNFEVLLEAIEDMPMDADIYIATDHPMWTLTSYAETNETENTIKIC